MSYGDDGKGIKDGYELCWTWEEIEVRMNVILSRRIRLTVACVDSCLNHEYDVHGPKYCSHVSQ